MSVTIDAALAGIRTEIRERLIAAYLDVKKHITESRPESAGLSAGKLCEAGIRLLQDRTFGKFTPFGTKIPNFADECRNIVTSKPTGPITDSEKLVISRALVFLYTMRNTRGIGHVGGDVDANVVDAQLMVSVADWIVCELIRVHHGLSLEEAQDLVDSIAIRRIPHIWEVGGKKRVLIDGLQARDQALLLLYSAQEAAVLTEDLIDWLEYSNPRVFKSNILSRLHKDRMVEWDTDSETVVLSPKGVQDVETRLLVNAQQNTAHDRVKKRGA